VRVDLTPRITRLPTFEHEPGRYRGVYVLPFAVEREQLAVRARIRDRNGIPGLTGGRP
jgi:hypothetical protein